MSSTRRQFIRNLTASGLTLGVGGSYAFSEGDKHSPLPSVSPGVKPKNLIFLVADGMNHGTLTLADYYSKEFMKRPSQWMQLYREASLSRSLMETSSASSLVTDSAAAGSAWGGGKRINNGAINVNPDGSQNTPLWLLAKDKNKATGLVTTTAVTHATPASFATAVPKRNMQETIAEQFLSNEIDVILGGGKEFFSPELRSDQKDMWQRFAQREYTVVKSKKELMATAHEKGRLLGTFYKGHLPYTIDQNNQPELAQAVPTLAEMMTVALERLVQHDGGFVLQVEGGRIDHAGHANDAGAIVHDQLAFDACIAIARQFIEKHPDTLVVLTTDHGTGGCHINGMGKAYNDTPALFKNLQQLKSSWEMLGRQLKPWPPSVDRIQSKLMDATGFEFSKKTLRDVLAKAQDNESRRALTNQLGALMAPKTSINWTTHNHTGECVEFCAFGPGSQNIPNYFENWELHHMLKAAVL